MTTENTPDPAAPDTIVLVHGLWVTPPQLGALDRALREQGIPRGGSRIPRP
jgi:hypothetical protein